MAYIVKTSPSKKFPKGGRKAKYLDKQGKWHSKTFATVKEAEQHLAINAADQVRGEWIDPALRRKLFDEWAARWLDGSVAYAATTRSAYWRLFKKHVEPDWTGREVGAIDFAEVKRWIREKQKAGYSPKYVREMVWVLAQVLDEAVDGGAIRSNSAKGHRLNRRKRKIGVGDVLDMEQAIRLIRECPEWLRPAVWVLLLTGLRPSELCGLRVKHLDAARGKLRAGSETLVYVGTHDGIPAHVEDGDGKTDAADRTIDVPPWLVEEILVELAERPRKLGAPVHRDDRLFLDWRTYQVTPGSALRPDVLRRLVRPALGRAGLPMTIRNYDLRHSHASILFALGKTPLEVSARMGHSQPSVTTDVYGHLFEGVQEKLTADLDAHRAAVEEGMEKPDVIVLDSERRKRVRGAV